MSNERVNHDVNNDNDQFLLLFSFLNWIEMQEDGESPPPSVARVLYLDELFFEQLVPSTRLSRVCNLRNEKRDFFCQSVLHIDSIRQTSPRITFAHKAWIWLQGKRSCAIAGGKLVTDFRLFTVKRWSCGSCSSWLSWPSFRLAHSVVEP